MRRITRAVRDPFASATKGGLSKGWVVGVAAAVAGLLSASSSASLAFRAAPGDLVCPPSEHSCFVAGPPGCDDIACCENVCEVDAFCCTVSWDGICVNEAMQLCAKMTADCDGDGVPDEIEIGNGSAVDLDADGVPDECAAISVVFQTDWAVEHEGPIVPFTDHGTMIVSILEPRADDVVWANATIGESWAIENVPLIAIDGQGGAESYALSFQLPTVFGVPAGVVPIRLSLSTQPIAGPPGGAPQLHPVASHVYDPGSVKDDPAAPDCPIFPGPMQPVPPIAGDSCETVSRAGVPGVVEDGNGCAPGAAARSIAWLISQYAMEIPGCLEPDPDLPEPACQIAQKAYEKLYMAMNTGKTGTGQFGVPGIKAFIDENFPCLLTVDRHLNFDEPTVNPCDMFDALKAGKDVMAIFGWYALQPDGTNKRAVGHQVTVSGAVKKGNEVQVFYRDDAAGGNKQGDDQKDKGVKKLVFKLQDVNTWVNPDVGQPAPIWEGFTVICPSWLVVACAIDSWRVEVKGANDPPGGARSDVDETLRTACRLREVAVAMVERLTHEPPVPAGALARVQAILERAKQIKILAQQMKDNGYSFELSAEISDLLMGVNETPGIDDLVDELKPLLDCNRNGKSDEIDIANGAPDNDHNGVPDECEEKQFCAADLDGNGLVDGGDLGSLLGGWGGGGAADLDGSGSVDGADLGLMLGQWGACDGA